MIPPANLPLYAFTMMVSFPSNGSCILTSSSTSMYAKVLFSFLGTPLSTTFTSTSHSCFTTLLNSPKAAISAVLSVAFVSLKRLLRFEFTRENVNGGPLLASSGSYASRVKTGCPWLGFMPALTVPS